MKFLLRILGILKQRVLIIAKADGKGTAPVIVEAIKWGSYYYFRQKLEQLDTEIRRKLNANTVIEELSFPDYKKLTSELEIGRKLAMNKIAQNGEKLKKEGEAVVNDLKKGLEKVRGDLGPTGKLSAHGSSNA